MQLLLQAKADVNVQSIVRLSVIIKFCLESVVNRVHFTVWTYSFV